MATPETPMIQADTIEQDPEGPYCHECGNDDPRQLAAIHNPANGTVYRCRVCNHEFIHDRRCDAVSA